MKLIFDTNIWISYFLCKSFPQLTSILIDNKYDIIISLSLLNELKTVLSRPKFQKIITPEQIEEIEQLLLIRGNLFDETQDIVHVKSRDQKDNFLVKLSMISNADYLVTGDEDLLIMKQIKNTQVLKWKEFLYSYESQ